MCTGGGIGDVLLATPVARALRERFGDVTAFTTPAHRDVLAHAPEVGEIWSASGRFVDDVRRVRARKFDAAVVTWASPRAAALPFLARIPRRAGQARRVYSRLFTDRVIVRSELGDRTSHWTEILLDFARALGCTPESAQPTFVVDAAARESLAATLAIRGITRPYLVLHPTRGISAARARWPLPRFVELARALGAAYGASVVISGAPNDRAFGDALAAAAGAGCVSLAGRTSLGEFGALAEASRAVVAMDSGPMHVAAAVGAPTVGVFALQSDEPDRWAPLGPSVATVRATYPCPASHRKETCPDFACVAALDIPRVIATLGALLAAKRTRNGGSAHATFADGPR